MKKRTIQALPAKLIDPRPVLLSGIGAWIVCLMTLLIVGVKTTAMWTAVWGIAIGLGIYVLSSIKEGRCVAATVPRKRHFLMLDAMVMRQQTMSP